MAASRRSFLRKGLLGGAILAAGGLGLSLWPTRMVAPRRPLVALDAFGLSIVASIAEAMSPGVDGVEVAHRADAFLAGQGEASLHDLGRLLRLVENGLAGVLFDLRPQPFSRMSIEGRQRALAAMRASRLALRRGGYHVLRRIVQAAHFTDPAVWPTLGYLGPPQLQGPT